MGSHTSAGRARLMAVLVAVMMFLSAITVPMYAGAAEESVYCTQIGKGKCTLASATMMMRQKAKNEGSKTWTSITQHSIMSTAWLNGAGLKHSFTYAGITVTYGDFSSTGKKAQLIAMLQKHPEGIEIYERALPHAIFLTRYDKSKDTFYCADPALSASERTLATSYLRHVSKSESASGKQADIINGLDAYWYVSKYNSKSTPAYDKSAVTDTSAKASDTKTDSTKNSAAANTKTNTGTQATKPSDNTGSSQTASDAGKTDTTAADQNTSVQKDENTAAVQEEPAAQENRGVADDSDAITQEVDEVAGGSTQTGTASSLSSGSIIVKLDTINSFSETSFKDVEKGAWYYNSVKTAYETGLMSGVSETLFDVNGKVTVAQAVTVAARIHAMQDVYNGEEYPTFSLMDGQSWYDPYADYAYAENVIATKYYTMIQNTPNQVATRAQFAEILSGSLSDNALTAINNIADGSISDIDATSSEGKAVYKLYRAGILSGNPDGTFRPKSTITRAEASSVIARMADSGMRVKTN